MNYDEIVTCGVAGSALSGTGAIMSVSEVQAVISIIVTVIGFIISVVIPTALKIYDKIKKAKADGKITTEEAKEISETIKEGVENITNGIEDIKGDKK